MKIKKKKRNYSKGYSLIEIILVLFIVSFVFVSVYTVLSKVSRHEKDNRYSLIASNLAQEGVEIIRNKRDENLLKYLDMNDGLSEGICYPYWNGTTPECDNSNKQAQMELDSEDIYRNCDSSGCSASNDIIFKRKCNVATSEDDLIEVACEVEWESPTLKTTKTIEIESYLTNWQNVD